MKDGIIYMSDIGYMDDDGFVYVLGRADDVINVGGLKVAPNEIEEVAMEIEGVEDCVCFPVNSDVLGYVPKLLLVMDKKTSFDVKAIRSHLAMRLENYKIPVYIEQVDFIHKTYNGKIDRKSYIK